MIKKLITLFFLYFLMGCGGIEFVLKESDLQNQFKNKTVLVFDEQNERRFAEGLFSFFGNNKNGDYILVTSFSEEKKNRLIKNNQVAEKVDYELTATYKLFYKKRDCTIINKKIVTKFSFVPKSFGYNFGADRSLEGLYERSIRKNIQKFIDVSPKSTNCL